MIRKAQPLYQCLCLQINKEVKNYAEDQNLFMTVWVLGLLWAGIMGSRVGNANECEASSQWFVFTYLL